VSGFVGEADCAKRDADRLDRKVRTATKAETAIFIFIFTQYVFT
jgi:hypothetical protein